MRGGLLCARRRASVATWTAVSGGGGSSRGARSRRSLGCGRTPRGGVGRGRGAGAARREDPVDHGGLGDARDDPHGPATRRARQRVAREDLLPQGRPPAGRLGRRQPGCGHHRGRIVRRGGRRLPPHAQRAIGLPAIVPRGDVPRVRHVHAHPGEALQRVHGLGARRRAPGLGRPAGHRVRAAVVGQPLQRDRMAGVVSRERMLEKHVIHETRRHGKSVYYRVSRGDGTVALGLT